MSRRSFAEILNGAGIDIAREYQRLIILFYKERNTYSLTLVDYVKRHFQNCPFKGTCISLSDFDETHGFVFPSSIMPSDLDTLILFCEYSCNMLNFIADLGFNKSEIEKYIQQVKKVINEINYKKLDHDGLVLFVPKSQAVSIAAQTVPAPTSYKLIEYNHHSLRGDIEAKKNILQLFANQLEAKREELTLANRTLTADLFALLNNLNIRHNNIDSSSTSYKEVVAKMSNEELERWYDDTYMLCVEAFITLDNIQRRDAVKALKALL